MKNCYNTFVVVRCRRPCIILVTSSARKANANLRTGYRVEVWNCNAKVETIYAKTRSELRPYIEAERDFIRARQEKATRRERR